MDNSGIRTPAIEKGFAKNLRAGSLVCLATCTGVGEIHFERFRHTLHVHVHPAAIFTIRTEVLHALIA